MFTYDEMVQRVAHEYSANFARSDRARRRAAHDAPRCDLAATVAILVFPDADRRANPRATSRSSVSRSRRWLVSIFSRQKSALFAGQVA